MQIFLTPLLASVIACMAFLCAWVQFDQKAQLADDEGSAEIAEWCRLSFRQALPVVAGTGLLYLLSLAL